jgi:hypothetical protein
MVTHQNPDDSHSVVSTVGLGLPECVTEWVFHEPSNVFECSPFLGHISWFSSSIYELSEVTVSFFSEGSSNHISTLIDVRNTVEETFNPTSDKDSLVLKVSSTVFLTSMSVLI